MAFIKSSKVSNSGTTLNKFLIFACFCKKYTDKMSEALDVIDITYAPKHSFGVDEISLKVFHTSLFSLFCIFILSTNNFFSLIDLFNNLILSISLKLEYIILLFFLKISFKSFSCLSASCLISNLARLIPKHLTLLIKSNRSALAI